MKNRLLTARSVSELENKYDENQQMYGQLRDIIGDARAELEMLNPESTDVNETIGVLEGIDDDFGRMQAIVDDCRVNGVVNEEQLNLGRERVDKLTATIDELKEELAKLEDIDDLRAEARRLATEVNQLEAELTSRVTEGAPKGNSRFICTFHEDVFNTLDEGSDKLTAIVNDLRTAGPVGIGQAVAKAVDVVTDVEANVLSSIGVAEDMNSRMGNAIEQRSEMIEKLADEIDELEDQLGTMGDDRAEALTIIDTLEAKLDDLESQLAN